MKNNIWFIYWLVCISMTISTGCSSRQSTEQQTAFDKIYKKSSYGVEFKFFQDDDKRYSLVYPESWLIVDTGNSNSQFVNLSLENEPFKGMVTMQVLKPRSGLQFTADALDQFLIDQPEVSEFQKEAVFNIQVNGLAGIESIASYRLVNAMYIQRAIFLQKDGNLYALTLLSLEKDRERYDPMFDVVITSLTIN